MPFEITDPPADIGRKFHADGSVRHFPGNTLVCHVRQGPLFAALARAHATMTMANGARAWSFLPPSSWHMTVFDGVCHNLLATAPRPADLPMDASGATVDAFVLDRLRGWHAGPALPLRLAPTGIRLGAKGGIGVQLAEADDDARADLRGLRDRIADRLDLRRPNHSGYGFHITFAYLTARPTETAQREMNTAVTTASTEFCETVPEIRFDDIAVCLFDDMAAFHPQFSLT